MKLLNVICQCVGVLCRKICDCLPDCSGSHPNPAAVQPEQRAQGIAGQAGGAVTGISGQTETGPVGSNGHAPPIPVRDSGSELRTHSKAVQYPGLENERRAGGIVSGGQLLDALESPRNPTQGLGKIDLEMPVMRVQELTEPREKRSKAKKTTSPKVGRDSADHMHSQFHVRFEAAVKQLDTNSNIHQGRINIPEVAPKKFSADDPKPNLNIYDTALAKKDEGTFATLPGMTVGSSSPKAAKG